MQFLIPLIFIFWFVAVLKNILFWIYMWQTKEYRIDRMRVHFELPTSKNLILNKKNAWLGILFLFSLAPFSLMRFSIAILVLVLYVLFSFRAMRQYQDNTIKIPRFTIRGSLVVFGVITTYILLSIVVFIFINKMMVSWFLIADILIPLFVAGFIGASHPVSIWIKNRIIKKATRKRERLKNLLVIGITGSYGKSSMKEILFTILKDNFNTIKTPKNINADIGIAKVFLKDATEKHDVFIVEMGAYKRGEIQKTTNMIKPQIGILTGINPQHISLFGSLQNIQKAKYELMESLPSKGLAIFNGDNENVRALYRQCKNPKRLYSTNPSIDHGSQKVLVSEISNTPKGLEISVYEDGEENVILKAPLLGKHNATNIVGAVTVARELGIDYTDIKRALLKVKAPPHTLQLKKGIKDSIVIDDAYASNEDGVSAALKVLDTLKGNKKICILQPLIELGDSAERVHKKIANEIAKVCDYLIVTSRDYYSIILKEAIDNGMSKDNIFCLLRPQEALRKAQELINKDDIVLVENRVSEVVLNGVTLHLSNE